MKNYGFLIPSALFPYCILLAGYCVSSGFLMDSFFAGSVYPLLLGIILIWIASFFMSTCFLSKNQNPHALAKAAMILKFIHAPAYIVNFGVAIMCLITIFTAGFSLLLLILALLTIILSGKISGAALARGQACGVFDHSYVSLHRALSFVFCLDVISAILVYRKVRRSESSH